MILQENEIRIGGEDYRSSLLALLHASLADEPGLKPEEMAVSNHSLEYEEA